MQIEQHKCKWKVNIKLDIRDLTCWNLIYFVHHKLSSMSELMLQYFIDIIGHCSSSIILYIILNIYFKTIVGVIHNIGHDR